MVYSSLSDVICLGMFMLAKSSLKFTVQVISCGVSVSSIVLLLTSVSSEVSGSVVVTWNDAAVLLLVDYTE